MGTCTAPAEAGVIELAPAIYFVNGLHRVDHIGNGNMMLTYFRTDVISDGHGSAVRFVEVKIVIHAADIPAARQMTVAAVESAALGNTNIPRLLM